MELPQFNSMPRDPTSHHGYGRGTEKSANRTNMGRPPVRTEVAAQLVPALRRPSQSNGSPDHYPHRSGFSDLVRSILPSHDSSSSSNSRRSQDIPISAAHRFENPRNETSLILDMERTLKALEGEQQMTRKLLEDKAALESENAKLVKANSGLAKECSTFRKQLQLESEEELIKALRELHNRIQTWCQKFRETTAQCRSTGEVPRLPCATPMVSYALVNLDKDCLPYLMAAVWEYLLDHIFEDPEASPKDEPRDLWTTRQNAKAVNNLEHELTGLNLKETTQWRSLTVRLLSQVAKDKYDEILQNISKPLHTILDEITKFSVLLMGRPQPAQLETLERELVVVVERAIEYSLMLRRQRSWVCLTMPKHEINAVGGIQSDKDLTSKHPELRARRAAPAIAQTRIFIRPQLVRFTTVTGETMAELFVVVLEPEEHRVLVFLDKAAKSERRRLTD